MIWLVLVAIAAVAAGGLLVSKSWVTRAIVAGSALLAAGGYWMVGRPGMGDEPYSMRVKAIEAKIKSEPEQVTAMEALAFLQKKARDNPKDPMPHKFMGDLYAEANMPNDAIMAYQAALRRDPDNVGAMTKLADVLFMTSQKVDEATAQLYARALELEPGNVRVAIMVGIGDWQAGRKAEAEARWAAALKDLPAESPLRQMYAALRNAFAPEGESAADSGKKSKP